MLHPMPLTASNKDKELHNNNNNNNNQQNKDHALWFLLNVIK